MGTLYVVPAPAGDPNDLTRRALRILEAVSLIVTDDQVSARALLRHCGIVTPLVHLPGDGHLDALAEGDVAYLHTGPSPALSESGDCLVHGALDRNCPVVPVPGPSLPITALVISGLPADSFVYLGELPQAPSERGKLLALVKTEPRTILVLVPSALLSVALADLHRALGDRPLALVASSTTGAQVVWRGRSGEASAGLDQVASPGVHVVVIGGTPAGTVLWDEERLRSGIQSLQAEGLGAKEISQQLAGDSGWSRREVYRLAVELAQGAKNDAS